MARPQIQEAVKQIADLLERPRHDEACRRAQADHFCMHWRAQTRPAKMTNSVMRGKFLADASLRREFLALLSGKDA
jgi:GTP cyclohydrolase I